VYIEGQSANKPERTLVWVDRHGKEEPLAVPSRAYAYARLSPDGTKIALDARDGDYDIWIWNVVSGPLDHDSISMEIWDA
jgi:hypothetical protein